MIGLGIAVARAGGFLKSLPREVWYIVGALLLAALAWWWVDRKIDAAYDRGYTNGVKYEADRTAAAAKRIKDRADKIAADIRKVTDEKIDRSDAVARTIILRGPGKAAYSCPSQPASSGRQPTSGRADAPVDRVPDPERSQLAVVPFADLVERARVCDANRLEVQAWREDHAKRSLIK